MAKRGPNKRRRIPKLCFTTTEGIGYYTTYRDPRTGTPHKHRFGIKEKSRLAEAELAYHKWLAQYLEDGPPPKRGRPVKPKSETREPLSLAVPKESVSGSVLEVSSAFLDALEARVRQAGAPRARGTIAPAVFSDRRKHVRDFLQHLNRERGEGAISRMRVADLTMQDVESFNAWAVKEGYSASQVNKRMQMVKALIDRAGRPEHGGQLLAWNWDSRDVAHGKPTEERKLPTVDQLKAVLAASDLEHQAMVWLAIGLGFGQRDLASVRVGHIDRKGYDLRRSKTGIERYGETPPLVWAYIQALVGETGRKPGDLLFLTRRGDALVHGRSDAVTQWWRKLRIKIGETSDTLSGFYTLRHLGATEFGSRDGCSISAMRRWLGHGASSQMADVYMRPVSPEDRKVVVWVRRRLRTTTLDR